MRLVQCNKAYSQNVNAKNVAMNPVTEAAAAAAAAALIRLIVTHSTNTKRSIVTAATNRFECYVDLGEREIA